MRQIILLETHEVERLRKGKTLVISTHAGDVMLQFDRPVADETANGKPEKVTRVCGLCDKSTNAHGVPFTKMGLSFHMSKVHGKAAKHAS